MLSEWDSSESDAVMPVVRGGTSLGPPYNAAAVTNSAAAADKPQQLASVTEKPEVRRLCVFYPLPASVSGGVVKVGRARDKLAGSCAPFFPIRKLSCQKVLFLFKVFPQNTKFRAGSPLFYGKFEG